MEEAEKATYLGTEKLSKLMLKFSIPCVLSLLISALYNIVDQIFVGNSELSDLGNAATGIVFPIFIIAQAFAWWFGDGCAAYLNICQGRKNAQNAHKAIGTGILFTLLASAVLMAVFFPLKRPLLTLFGASQNTLELAVTYFNIILAFFPVYMLMNMMNAVIRADGSPGWSMASMLAGAVINIILDPVFIFACGWGMAGAAWATVIGQTASLGISVFYFFRTKTFRLTLKSFIPDMKEFASAVKLGASSFATQMAIVLISLVCNILLKKYGAMSEYGEDIPIAIIAIESKVFTVVINLVVGVVLGCQPIISYNLGAKNYTRVKQLYKYILICALSVGFVFTLLFETAPVFVVRIFGEPKFSDPDAYWEFGKKTFRIFLAFVTVTCVVKMSSIFFQAVGKPVFAVLTSMIRDIACFIPLLFIFSSAWGIIGLLYAAPAADAIAICVTVAFTIVFFKKLNKEQREIPPILSEEKPPSEQK